MMRTFYCCLADTFEKPTRDTTLKLKHGTYDKLGDDGLVHPGAPGSGEDIIIGKTAPIPQDNEELDQRSKNRPSAMSPRRSRPLKMA